MNKKIIALALVLVLMVTVFTACGKDYLTIEINGYEYVLATDEEGNTRVNEDGEIVIHPTEKNGEICTNEDGSYQENNIEFPNAIIKGQTLETIDYKLTMPEEWTALDSKKFVLKDSDEAVHVAVYNLGDDKGDFETYIQKAEKQVSDIIIMMEEQYSNITSEKVERKITAKDLDCVMFDFRCCDDNNMLVYSSYSGYFTYEDNLYKVEYVCQKAASFIEPETVMDLVSAGLELK